MAKIETIKVGNTSFSTEALKGLKKDDFKKTYKGKLNMDLDAAWDKIKPFTRKSKS